ncbi:hypothetical protein Tco_0124948 [Tanacetum coccineum]
MFLSQRQYAAEILERAYMVNFLHVLFNILPLLDRIFLMRCSRFVFICMIYESLIFLALERILRYVRGTLDHGLQFIRLLLHLWLLTQMLIGLVALLLDDRLWDIVCFFGKILLSWSPPALTTGQPATGQPATILIDFAD